MMMPHNSTRRSSFQQAVAGRSPASDLSRSADPDLDLSRLSLWARLRIWRRRLEQEYPLLWAGLAGLAIAAAGYLLSAGFLLLGGGL